MASKKKTVMLNCTHTCGWGLELNSPDVLHDFMRHLEACRYVLPSITAWATRMVDRPDLVKALGF